MLLVSVLFSLLFSRCILCGTPLQVAFVTGVGCVIVSVLMDSEDDPHTQSTRTSYIRLAVVRPATPHYVVHPPSPSVSTVLVEHFDETLVAEQCDDETDLLATKTIGFH